MASADSSNDIPYCLPVPPDGRLGMYFVPPDWVDSTDNTWVGLKEEGDLLFAWAVGNFDRSLAFVRLGGCEPERVRVPGSEVRIRRVLQQSNCIVFFHEGSERPYLRQFGKDSRYTFL